MDCTPSSVDLIFKLSKYSFVASTCKYNHRVNQFITYMPPENLPERVKL